MLLRVGFDLGGVQQAQGRLGAALRTYRRARRRPRPAARRRRRAWRRWAWPRCCYERDELAAAAEHATAGIERCRRLAYAPPLVDGLLVLARIRQAAGRPGRCAGARSTRPTTVMPEAVDLRVPLRAMRRAGWRWPTGDVRRGRSTGSGPRPRRRRRTGLPARAASTCVLARVLIAEHRPRPGAGDAGALAGAGRRPGPHRRASSPLQVLAALAHAASGDEPAALAALAEALTLAAPEGHLRVFLDEGAPLAALLRTLLAGRRLEQLAGARRGAARVPAPAWPRRSTGRARPSSRRPGAARSRCRGWSSR